jgi:hypothetical protein
LRFAFAGARRLERFIISSLTPAFSADSLC